MRWYVDIASSLADAPPERWVVEAGHWQPALEQARRLRGDDANLRGFSVEILDDGCRAVDPATMARYTALPAPPGTPLSTASVRPSKPPAPAAAEAVGDAPSRADRIAAMLSIEPQHVSRPARAASRPPGEGRTAGALVAPPEKNAVFEELPPARLLYERSQDPSPTVQITYRESAWCVAPGTPADAAHRLLVGMFEGLRASLAGAPPGQIINMAIFDFSFEGRPPGPPLVSLSWKDWKDQEPVVKRPRLTTRPPPAPSAPPPAEPVPAEASRRPKRLSGDDLISGLFESMHEVHFVRDSLSGAKFMLSLMLDKLPSEAGLVHFFDINMLEFVVVRAAGPGSEKVLLFRTPEKEPLIAQAMSTHRSVVIADANGDARLKGGRWAQLGLDVRSVAIAPVEQGGRFLGLLELVNPLEGGGFTEGDGHGLTYLGQQFAEFLAARGLLLDPERIEKG
jgi:GAF domain